MMNGRRLQIGTVSVSASPWVGTQSGVSPIQSPLEAEAVEGCQAQLHLLPMGGLGVPGQRSKKGLMGAGGGELADLIIPTSIIYLSVIFLTEPAHGGPPSLPSWLHFVLYSSEEVSAKKAGLQLESKLKCLGSVPELALLGFQCLC